MRSAASTPPPRNWARLQLLRLIGRTLPARARPRSKPERVLLLRPDHIGDVLLTASAIALLRESLPGAHLTYVVGPWSVEAARRGPAVDEVRILAYPGFTRRRNRNLADPYAGLLREAARLRSERYDVAVVLRADHWWGALLALVAGIAVRVGGDTPETSPLLTHAYATPADQSWAEQALGIARLALNAVGALPAAVDDAKPFTVNPSVADAFWQQHGLGDGVVAIHPAAGAPLKSWPIERWARLADALIDSGRQVVLTGAPGDVGLLDAVGKRMRGYVPALWGQSLEVSAAVYARCALVIAVDSGAGHLAAAVGTSTVRLYGPAPTTVFGPWPARGNQRVLCAAHLACAPCGFLESPPCGAATTPACMLAIGVDDVLKAANAELNRS
ncbi:MAG: glycosyltransferase family 9 protein [Chloroflexi bacterium]|nr:glycosyltransferase family 9 protein [Chloroflexota bacterium]